MTSDVLTDGNWDDLGFHDATELGGGWQSRVFRANGFDGEVAVKLTSAPLVDRVMLERKTALVDHLARDHASVVAPVRVCGSLVHPFGGWLVTATQFVEGEHPDHFDASHGELMGSSLAELHHSMGELPAVELDRVAALRTDMSGRWESSETDQLLHGDFASSNLVCTSDGIRIFDFDDCGYGPAEFDVANSLYMVVFDSWVSDRTTKYPEFKTAFVGGYEELAQRVIDLATVESLMDVRVMALQRWAANPSEAPIGIRNSPTEWIDTLNRFVKVWFVERAIG